MVSGFGRRLGGLAVGCAAVALLVTGCYGESKPPKQETIPAGPDVSPPAISPSPASPAPSVAVNPKAGCVNVSQVLDALIYADPDTPPSAQAKLSGAPVCAAGWAFALVTAPNTEDARVVLRNYAGRWQVLTYGSAPCSEPRVADAPAAVRTAAGC
jgi:hypothetical protein